MPKAIKVAYLLGSLNRGGAETMLLDLMNQHDLVPYEMIGISRHEGELGDSFYCSGVPFIRLSVGKNLNIIGYLTKLRQLLKTHHINIVHSHQSVDTIYGFLASIGLNIKIIQTVHGFDFQSGITGKLLKYISFLIADKTIFVSNTQKKYYSSKYIIKQKKIQVIYNGIDLRRFSLKYNFTLRESLNIGHDAFLMGMVGNFSPGRDHLTICKFLLLLHKLEFNFEFLFIGGKNLSYPDLYVNCVSFCEKNGINDKIHFLGIRKDVPELLSQLDLFIFSTNHDAFGNSVLEAMASGIPVIVNDWEVMKEIFNNEGKAILFESKSHNDLLNKFLIFHSNMKMYKQKSIENVEWIKQNFCIIRHIDKLVEVYNNA